MRGLILRYNVVCATAAGAWFVAGDCEGYAEYVHFLAEKSLWRVTDVCVEVTDPNTRKELRSYARDEFERNKNVTDIVCITISLDHFGD